jgi:hypothetical protein
MKMNAFKGILGAFRNILNPKQEPFRLFFRDLSKNTEKIQ